MRYWGGAPKATRARGVWRRRGCCFVVLVTFRRAGGRDGRGGALLAALVRRGRRCVSDALSRRRASRAALCRSSIARLLRSKRSDWPAVGPLHLPHAHASCNRTSPLCRHKCDSRQYQAAATSHHRCRSGARGRCREAESPATSASPRPVLLFSNGKLPSLDDKWEGQVMRGVAR